MNNIIPPSINDKFNVLFKYVNNLYSSFLTLTATYFIIDDTNNQITVKGNTFSIDTTQQKINYGSLLSPDLCLLHSTEQTDIINEDSVPNGSLFLLNSNYGESYLKLSDVWTQISTVGSFKLGEDITISSTSGGENYFATSSLIPLSINGIYEIEYHLYFKKISSGTVTFVIDYDYQPLHHIIECEMNNKTGIITNSVTLNSIDTSYSEFFYNPSSSTVSITTLTVNNNDVKYMKIKMFLTNISTDNKINLLIYNSDGLVKALKNSYWISKRISNLNSSVS